MSTSSRERRVSTIEMDPPLETEAVQGWRVTKYDPRRRDAAGRYLETEWTSVSDIGRVIAGHLLDVAAYSSVEDAYVETAMAFHADAGAPVLFARDVEMSGKAPNIAGAVLSSPPSEESPVGRGELPVWIRSCLREIVWCRLESPSGNCMIHFGYDYYMYLTGPRLEESTRALATARGLYLEPFESPYLRSP